MRSHFLARDGESVLISDAVWEYWATRPGWSEYSCLRPGCRFRMLTDSTDQNEIGYAIACHLFDHPKTVADSNDPRGQDQLRGSHVSEQGVVAQARDALRA